MQFTKTLRDAVRLGEITSSIRIWKYPRVKVGNSYPMEDGCIIVESLSEIELGDITTDLAQESGFESVDELLKLARHGTGDRVFMVAFRYSDNTLHAGGFYE